MKRFVIVPLTAALAALGACAADDDDQADVEVAAMTATAATKPAAAAPTTTVPSSPAPRPTDAPPTTASRSAVAPRVTTSPTTTTTPTAAPLATWEGDTGLTSISDDEALRLHAELLSLTRATDVVTLEFSLQAVGVVGTWSANDSFSEGPNATGLYTMNGVTLLDLVNGNRHLTLLDEAGACLCSSGLGSIEGDQRLELYAQFPAPPPEVTAVSVVIPNIPPFENVPISEGS